MAAVRSMLARVQRLEQARAPVSPFVRCFGSFDAWVDDCRAGVDAGLLDAGEMPVVIAAVERWHRDVWAR